MTQNPMFIRDYQMGLLAHLYWDKKFFERTKGILRLSDFDIPGCSLVYETLKDYFVQFSSLPDSNTLPLHVQYMLGNMGGKTETLLGPEHYEGLASVINTIYQLQSRLNTPYYQAQLPAYLMSVRVSQRTAMYTPQLMVGQGSQAYVEDIVKMHTELSNSSAKDSIFTSPDMEPEPMLTASTFKRITTGLTKLDRYMSGGLGEGEIGMVTACTGVGKTTSLLNFSIAAMRAGWRVLFLTLEMNGRRIKHRWQGIASHIPASQFRLPIPTWPVDMQWRFNEIITDRFKFRGYTQVVDMSGKPPELSSIDNTIQQWKEMTYNEGGDPEQCKFVAVDWLDRISKAELARDKNTRDDILLTNLTEKLADITRRNKVALWTATQGTRDAVGKETLNPKNIAHSFHKSDALDVSLGLAPKNVISGKAFESGTCQSDDQEQAPSCDRDMVWSFMKNRDNPPDVRVDCYQGKTLRLWNNKSEAAYYEEALQARAADALKESRNGQHGPNGAKAP